MDKNEIDLSNNLLEKIENLFEDLSCSSESEKSYDTFDTSDDDILEKQEIKMEIMQKIEKKPETLDLRYDFNTLFKKELKKCKKPSKIILQMKENNDSKEDDSDDEYLYGYKFF